MPTRNNVGYEPAFYYRETPNFYAYLGADITNADDGNITYTTTTDNMTWVPTGGNWTTGAGAGVAATTFTIEELARAFDQARQPRKVRKVARAEAQREEDLPDFNDGDFAEMVLKV